MHVADDTAPNSHTYALPDAAATEALGALLAKNLPKDVQPAAVVYLEGDLGAGKTTLVRGLLRAVGELGAVKSPTYTLVEPHVVSGLNLYHFDFYRFKSPEEFLDAGLDEYFVAMGWCLVEWPDRAQPYLPSADLHIHLELAGSGRQARLGSHSVRGLAWLSALPVALPAVNSCMSPAPA